MCKSNNSKCGYSCEIAGTLCNIMHILPTNVREHMGLSIVNLPLMSVLQQDMEVKHCNRTRLHELHLLAQTLAQANQK